MKNLLVYIILILSFAASATAQTAQTADETARLQLVNALERSQNEVRASRRFIDALKEQVESKENRIKALNDKDALSQKAIEGLQSEIKNLRLAIDEQTAALKIRETEVAELKKDLDKTRKKLHRARQIEKYLVLVAGGIFAAFLLK